MLHCKFSGPFYEQVNLALSLRRLLARRHVYAFGDERSSRGFTNHVYSVTMCDLRRWREEE
jgi:hypothetical protein